MRTGDIVFVRGKNVISRLIKYFDNGQFSHVAIAISSTEIVEAQYGMDVVRRKLPIDYDCDIMDIGLIREQRVKVICSCMKLMTKKYDFMQLVWYVLRKVFHLKGKNPLNNPNNLICSELVYTVLEDTGILKELGIKSTQGRDSTPNELYDLVKYLGKKVN